MGQPGGRLRTAPGRADQPRRSAAGARPGVLLRGHAGAAARRRGAPGLLQPLHPGPLGRGAACAAPASTSATLRRGRDARGLLPGRRGRRRRLRQAQPCRRWGRAGRGVPAGGPRGPRGPAHRRSCALAGPLRQFDAPGRRRAPALRRRRGRHERRHELRRRARAAAGHRPGSGRRAAGRPGPGPRRDGAADLLHRGRTRRRPAGGAGRQVPAAGARRALRVDVAHDGRHPPARTPVRHHHLGRPAAAQHAGHRPGGARARPCPRAARPLRPPRAVALRHLGRPAHPDGDGQRRGRHRPDPRAEEGAADVDHPRDRRGPGGAQRGAAVLPRPGAAGAAGAAIAAAGPGAGTAGAPVLGAACAARQRPATRRALHAADADPHPAAGRRPRAGAAGRALDRGHRAQQRGRAAASGPCAGRAPAAGSRAAATRRPLRSRPWWLRLRGLAGPASVAALGQCAGEPRFRLPGHRTGRRLHLGRQQPHAPGHALVQRPAAGPARRVAAAARPGQRPRLAAGPPVAPRRAAGDRAWHRLFAQPPAAGRPERRAVLVRRSRGDGEAGAGAPRCRGARRRRTAATAAGRPGRMATGQRARRTPVRGDAQRLADRGRARRRAAATRARVDAAGDAAGPPGRLRRRDGRAVHPAPPARRRTGRRTGRGSAWRRARRGAQDRRLRRTGARASRRAGLDLRPARVLRQRGPHGPAQGAVPALRWRARRLRGIGGADRARGLAAGRAHRAAGPRPLPRSDTGADGGRVGARSGGAAGTAAAAMAGAAGRPAGVDAGSALRRADEPLAAVPDAGVPDVGPRRLLPGRWCLRLSRPAAGRDGADRRRAAAAGRPDPAQRRAAVPGGRRAALVA